MSVYEIRVQGRLGQHWTTWFAGLRLTYEGDDTVLPGVGVRKEHEQEMNEMSQSTRTSKIASALLLLKKDPLMKLKLIGYWVATAYFVFNMLLAAGGELLLKPGGGIDQIRVHEGYPTYVLTLLGVWKLLGIIALLVPRFPRLKEWAYAGFFFDLTGAAVSGIASGGAGDPGTTISLPIILILFALASWALRPSSRTLGVLFPRRQLA